MKTIICCLVLSWLTYLFLSWRRRRQGKTPDPQPIENLLAFSIIGAVAGFVIAMAISVAVPNQTNQVNRPLVTIRSTDGKTGNYFSAVSGILGTPAFRVYTRNDDRSLSSHLLPSDTFIVESATLHGQGVWRITAVNKDPSSPLYSWALCIDRDWDVHNYIVLPAGSFVP